MRPPRALAISLAGSLAVAAVIAMAACDDSDSDGTNLTPAEYRHAGNEICRSIDAEISAVLGGGRPTVDTIQDDLAPRLSAALTVLGDGLNRLRPPAELVSDHEQLVTAIDSSTDTLDAAVADRALATQLAEEGPPMDEIDRLATELGLTACTAPG
jgi:hypothetical protein